MGRSLLPIAKRHRVLKRCAGFLIRSRVSWGNLFFKFRGTPPDSSPHFFEKLFSSFLFSASSFHPPFSFSFSFSTHSSSFFKRNCPRHSSPHYQALSRKIFELFFRGLASMLTTGQSRLSVCCAHRKMYEFHVETKLPGKFFIKLRQRRSLQASLNRCFLNELSWHAVCQKK